MSIRELLNPAGGIRYHLRARSYRRELWQPFRMEIGEYILRWKPRESTLLLVGPSAGYCLQPFFFERFERVVCLEPDPIARWLFARKIAIAPLESRPRLEFISQDHLVRFTERLPKLVRSLGDCALLFSNVLGQIRGLLEVDDSSTPEFVRIRNAVQEATEGRAFASFHDRVSGNIRPTFAPPLTFPQRLGDAELLENLFKHARFADGERRELLDHLTAGFFAENLPHSYFVWRLEPGRYHVIEAVNSLPR